MSSDPETPDPPGSFSLDIGPDLREMRDWVHGFAAGTIRPAAAEWDEREETPWPVLEEAAKVGLYSLDFFGQQWLEPSGLGIPIAFEELFWGDAGIALSLVGTTLATVAVVSNGTPEQIGEWAPQMFGTPGDVKLGSFCASEPDAGSDIGSIRTRAEYSEATDEWILNGTKAWATNGGIAEIHVIVASVDPSLGTRGQASFIVPPGTPGLSQGQKFRKHGIRASHTAEVVLNGVRVPGRCLIGGKERLDERLGRIRAGGRGSRQQREFETGRVPFHPCVFDGGQAAGQFHVVIVRRPGLLVDGLHLADGLAEFPQCAGHLFGVPARAQFRFFQQADAAGQMLQHFLPASLKFGLAPPHFLQAGALAFQFLLRPL